MKRNYAKLVRLNQEERQRLRKQAKKCGLSEEAYLRSLLNGFLPKELPPPDYHDMMRELNVIGNSINQIAARANATGFFLAEEYAGYMAEFRDTVLNIQHAVTQPERI